MKKFACLTIFALLFQLLLPIQLASAQEPLHEITSVSTTEITPGETILTITGTGFGSPFNSENNQICFGANDCRDASDLNDYLQAWSDTEATLLVPEDITATPSTILLKVYFYDTQTFDYIESPGQYTIAEEPEPEPEPEDEGIVIYIGEGCPYCEHVQSYIAEN
ncbi:MAG: IPT/TIG domain-containing protein, partial [Candidatus Gracilibacteria bacterium]